MRGGGCCFHLNHSNQVQNTEYMSTKLSYFCHIQKTQMLPEVSKEYLPCTFASVGSENDEETEKKKYFVLWDHIFLFENKSCSEHNFHFKSTGRI